MEQPSDAAFAAYYNMDMENLEVEMGFPVDKELAGNGEIIASQTYYFTFCAHSSLYHNKVNSERFGRPLLLD